MSPFSASSNRLVMVIHGPEIFDSGEAEWLIDLIKPFRTIVAGVMARTAAEESNLPLEFQSNPPSYVIRDLGGPVVLANRGKTPESGQIFGDIVASRLYRRGLVQIECSSKTIFVWDGGEEELASTLSRLMGFSLIPANSTRYVNSQERKIRGCIPGEAVYVNGIIIGRATSETVVLERKGGKINPISGLSPKVHGLEKLSRQGPIELSIAWCKSGVIRSVLPHINSRAEKKGIIVVIDHCGHEIYRKIGNTSCGVLAIGDDTTAVAGHILAHRGLPVLGIVDGDLDSIVKESFAPGSVVVEVCNGRDDELGLEVATMITSSSVSWDEWVNTVLKVFGDRVKIVVDMREQRNAMR